MATMKFQISRIMKSVQGGVGAGLAVNTGYCLQNIWIKGKARKNLLSPPPTIGSWIEVDERIGKFLENGNTCEFTKENLFRIIPKELEDPKTLWDNRC